MSLKLFVSENAKAKNEQELIVQNLINEQINARMQKHLIQKDHSRCCNEHEVKFIQSHGGIDTEHDSIRLPEGYKVIIFSRFGRPLSTCIEEEETLKDLYRNGHTLFEENDNNPIRKTIEGWYWLIPRQRATMLWCGIGPEDVINPRLFVGGSVKIDGQEIFPTIPEISLDFDGNACENWGGDSTTKNDYNCFIDCISPGVPASPDTRCEKYYMKKNVLLSDIMRAGGPGTYVVLACLSITNKDEREKIEEADRLQHILSDYRFGSPAYATRSRAREIYQGYDGQGGKRKLRHKRKNTKKNNRKSHRKKKQSQRRKGQKRRKSKK